MTLTPEQIEAVLPQLAKPLRQTLAAYVDIVEQLAEWEANQLTSEDGFSRYCPVCGAFEGEQDEGNPDGDTPLVDAARKLRGKHWQLERRG